MRYRMIDELSGTHAVGDLCQLLGVTRSGYYAWRSGRESAREIDNQRLTGQITEVFEAKRKLGRQITLQEVDSRPVPSRLRDGVARLLTPYL